MTGAGVVLAGTFLVLGVLFLVALTEIGLVVALGVLVDTLIARSVPVPGPLLDTGNSAWWPSSTRTFRPIGPATTDDGVW
jgi:putative drug exporter of the RND superfamily